MSHALFDALRALTKCKSDADLARHLGITRQQLCGYRSGKVTIGPAMIGRINAATGWPNDRIHELTADKAPAVARRPEAKRKADPAKNPGLTITKTPQWVSRVHRIM